MTRERVNDSPDVSVLLGASVRAIKDDPREAKARFQAAAADHCPHCGVKHRSLTPDQCADRSMSEKTLQARVRARAKSRGWKDAHVGAGIAAFTADGTPVFVTAMSPGWPDLTLAKAGHRLVFMEFKREQGEVSEEQWFWLDLLNRCGARAVIIRPSDLREGRVNAILNVGSPLD